MPELTEYREIGERDQLLRRWSAEVAYPVGHPLDQATVPDGDREIDGPYRRQQMIDGEWVTIFERRADGACLWTNPGMMLQSNPGRIGSDPEDRFTGSPAWQAAHQIREMPDIVL